MIKVELLQRFRRRRPSTNPAFTAVRFSGRHLALQARREELLGAPSFGARRSARRATASPKVGAPASGTPGSAVGHIPAIGGGLGGHHTTDPSRRNSVSQSVIRRCSTSTWAGGPMTSNRLRRSSLAASAWRLQVGGGVKPGSARDRRDRAAHRCGCRSARYTGATDRAGRAPGPGPPITCTKSLPTSVPSKSTGYSYECPIYRTAYPPLLALAHPVRRHRVLPAREGASEVGSGRGDPWGHAPTRERGVYVQQTQCLCEPSAGFIAIYPTS